MLNLNNLSFCFKSLSLLGVCVADYLTLFFPHVSRCLHTPVHTWPSLPGVNAVQPFQREITVRYECSLFFNYYYTPPSHSFYSCFVFFNLKLPIRTLRYMAFILQMKKHILHLLIISGTWEDLPLWFIKVSFKHIFICIIKISSDTEELSIRRTVLNTHPDLFTFIFTLFLADKSDFQPQTTKD